MTLAANASVTFPVTTGNGGTDEWTIAFTTPDPNPNRCVFRNSKHCNITAEDTGAGAAINLNLGNVAQGFSIVFPVSSSCFNNEYKISGTTNPCPPGGPR
jgi:hypothetical protein